MSTREKFTTFDDQTFKYSGLVESIFDFTLNTQLLHPELWKRFVMQFREDSDSDAGWRGEYWGKMMRGASLVYAYTKNETLYDILSETIRDMIESADETGRISSYARNHEFDGWDLWCRKYVLLGMQYFLEVCKCDSLYSDIIESMKRQADYIIAHIGKGTGKIDITKATQNWNGLNSSSILEPFVRLFTLTNEHRYLDFAEYIISTGAIDNGNIFELAYENKLYPYQYPVTKAYEMISCFEGLLEYYKICGNEKFKTAIINFADKILESDFTVIGTSGCTHELFDNSTYTQHIDNNKEMQETCVTVTLMKFFQRVHLLTGDPKYADAVEISFYNAYMGAMNTENQLGDWKEKYAPYFDVETLIYEPLPFDSYSPLTSGRRGIGVGGMKPMSDNHYYGCCACISSAGIGTIPRLHYAKTQNGIVVNMFINGTAKLETPSGNTFILNTQTLYPKDGKVNITFSINNPEHFEILIRNPSWSEDTKVFLNGKAVSSQKGYITLEKVWENGDVIELLFDMRTKVIYPLSPKSFDSSTIKNNHIALRRGPLMLAEDSRLGYSTDEPQSFKIEENNEISTTESSSATYPCIVQADIPLSDGRYITLTDYASSGKIWDNDKKIAVWLLAE